MLPGVILAGGDSSRMGSPKALLLTPDGKLFVSAIVEAFAAAGIADIIVVTGRHHDEIVGALSGELLPVIPRVVHNPDPSRGQLSSLHIAMDAAVTPRTPALVVTLVDVPLTSAATVQLVIAEWRRTGAAIVRPAIGDRHGHPVVFDRRLFAALRAAPFAAGAKAVVHAHAHEILNIAVTDEGCLRDIDTPEDYRALNETGLDSRPP